MKKYLVFVHYSVYLSIPLEAESEDEAIIKGRKIANQQVDMAEGNLLELAETLEAWEEADIAEEISEDGFQTAKKELEEAYGV